MKIEDMLLTKNPYSRPAIALNKVNAVVVHYMGNPNTTAKANRNYFENLKTTKTTYASSHYIIGLEGEIIRCVPESEIAYCSNHRNSDTISIECCHPDATGIFNEKTYNSLIWLLSDICIRYKIEPVNGVIRHYDVTGKMCPLYYVKNINEWNILKSNVVKKINNSEKGQQEMVEKIEILVNGKSEDVETILKDGYNFIKLRELEKFGFSVGFDSDKKVPSIDYKVAG